VPPPLLLLRPAVILNANRHVTGTLRGFDQFMNVVLDQTVDMKTKTDIGMVVRAPTAAVFPAGVVAVLLAGAGPQGKTEQADRNNKIAQQPQALLPCTPLWCPRHQPFPGALRPAVPVHPVLVCPCCCPAGHSWQ
jgi:small nuclear ribonucleoprotein (snRNP)-like protein